MLTHAACFFLYLERFVLRKKWKRVLLSVVANFRHFLLIGCLQQTSSVFIATSTTKPTYLFGSQRSFTHLPSTGFDVYHVTKSKVQLIIYRRNFCSKLQSRDDLPLGRGGNDLIQRDPDRQGGDWSTARRRQPGWRGPNWRRMPRTRSTGVVAALCSTGGRQN